MARGVNKVILIGNLGKDPEVRYMPSGSAVTNVTLATSESWRDKQTGEQQERTEWHNIAFFTHRRKKDSLGSSTLVCWDNMFKTKDVFNRFFKALETVGTEIFNLTAKSLRVVGFIYQK